MNILLLMTDQQRADSLGLESGLRTTPALDALAAEGVRFTNCSTPAPVCVPARFALATGHTAPALGLWRNGRYTLPAQIGTWMQRVREAGYRTALFGKTHLHPHHGDLRDRAELLGGWGIDDADETPGPRSAVRCGSDMTDEWRRAGVLDAVKADYAQRYATKPWLVRPAPLPLQLYYDTYVGTRAARYLEHYKRTEPWCCWVSFAGPHEPWDCPEPYASMFADAEIPGPRPAPQGRPDRPHGYLDARIAKRPELGTDGIRSMRVDYAGNVRLIDDQIAEILAVIAARGELDRTAVVFCSDHGEMNGDAGLLYKNVFLDGSVRVPLIVRIPGGPAGLEIAAPVDLLDVAATLVQLAGGEADSDDGPGTDLGSAAPDTTIAGEFRLRSSRPLTRFFAPQAEHSNGSRPPGALSAYGGELMWCTEQWKAASNADGEVYLLFDRASDPYEQRNLAGEPEYRAISDELRLAMFERLVLTRLRTPLVGFGADAPTSAGTDARSRRPRGFGRRPR
jgi:arylsulfatase